MTGELWQVGRPFHCLSILTTRLRSVVAALPQPPGSTAPAGADPDTAAEKEEEEEGSCIVGLLPLKDPDELLAHLLAQHRRRLTPAQSTHVAAAAARGGEARTPLFLTLVANQAAEWRSYTDPPPLPTTLRGAIGGLFARLEAANGARIVRATAAHITLARQGVSEAELQELLSLDDAVLADVYQWSDLSGQIRHRLGSLVK